MLLFTLDYNGFDIKIYDHLKSVPEYALSKNASFDIKVEYLQLLEDTAQRDLNFRYVLVTDNKNDLKAFFYFQILKFSGSNINLPDNFLLNAALKIALTIRPVRLLISGNLFAVNFPSIKYDPSVFTVNSLLEITSRIEEKIKCDVLMLKDLDAAFNTPVMEQFNFVSYSHDLTMSLQIKKEWKSIADYKHELKKKYRKRAEKILAAGKNLERRELNVNEIRTENKRINQLFENVSGRQKIRMGQINSDYFYECKKRFPDAFTFTAFYHQNKMVSFVTYVDHGEILEVHYIGIDYDLNNSMMLYFNLLFDALSKGIKMEKEQLELGRTAREAKANLGAEPVFFNDYLRYKSKLAIRLAALIGKQFQNSMGEKWAIRSPFVGRE